MPTTSWSPLVRVPFTWRSKASAGGQLEHPSEVNSSTSTTFCAGAPPAICACRAKARERAIPAAIGPDCLLMDPPAAHKTRTPAGELQAFSGLGCFIGAGLRNRDISTAETTYLRD